jgi:hypothetical protein
MTNYIHSPRLNYPKLNYGQSPTDRIVLGNTIFSSSIEKDIVSNQNTEPNKAANFPKDDNGGITLLSLNAFMDKPNNELDIVVIPPKPFENQPPNFPDDTLGIIGNIYSFDILLLDDDISDGFYPANMILTEPYVPGGSAYITTAKQFWNDRIAIGSALANQIKDLPPFNQIIEEVPEAQKNKRLLAAGKWLIENDLVPRFYVPKAKNFSQDTIKYSYCQYNGLTSEFIFCGLAESHELNYIQSKFIGMGMQQYDMITYPVVLYPNLVQPMCEKCYKWVVSCSLLFEDIILEPYDENIHGNPGGTPPRDAEKLFYDLDEAKKFRQEQLDGEVKFFALPIAGITVCNMVYPLCYNRESWNTQYPPDKYPPHDTIEECEDTLKFVVVCEFGQTIVSNDMDSPGIITYQVLNDEDLQELINMYEEMEDVAYRIFDSIEEAEDYAAKSVWININGECFLLSELCAEANGFDTTYEKLEDCENAPQDDSGASGSYGDIASISKNYYFDKKTNSWILK